MFNYVSISMNLANNSESRLNNILKSHFYCNEDVHFT